MRGVGNGRPFLLDLNVGVIVSRWAPRSSKPVAGRAERAAVGSTPIHSRLLFIFPFTWPFGVRYSCPRPK